MEEKLNFTGFLKKNMFSEQWALSSPEQYKWEKYWRHYHKFEISIKKLHEERRIIRP